MHVAPADKKTAVKRGRQPARRVVDIGAAGSHAEAAAASLSELSLLSPRSDQEFGAQPLSPFFGEYSAGGLSGSPVRPSIFVLVVIRCCMDHQAGRASRQ